jgi:hypothetical protein
MKLLRNDLDQVYVWVSDDEKTILSPHFDYEDDADAWFYHLRENFKNKVHSIKNISYRHEKQKK